MTLHYNIKMTAPNGETSIISAEGCGVKALGWSSDRVEKVIDTMKNIPDLVGYTFEKDLKK